MASGDINKTKQPFQTFFEQLKEELVLLNELIESTEGALKAKIEANYQDQFSELKKQAQRYGIVEKDLL